jgi:hypothetical protein
MKHRWTSNSQSGWRTGQEQLWLPGLVSHSMDWSDAVPVKFEGGTMAKAWRKAGTCVGETDVDRKAVRQCQLQAHLQIHPR